MTVIFILFILILILHALLALMSLRRYPKQKDRLLSFSVVIVAHNEETMVRPLLESILELDYPHDKLEIILVDDNSSDNTWGIFSTFARENQNIIAIRSNPAYQSYKGKKAGLQSALDIVSKEIVIFTDADASVPHNWLKSFNMYFTEKTGLVIGYIRGEKISHLKRYKRIFSSGLFSAFSGIGYPFSCSGGNLAIKRELLEKVGGYTSIKDFPSGDDKQMLNLIRKTKFKIAYNSDVKVIERERNLTSQQQYQQSIRHYGKFSLSSPFYQLAFLVIICYYLSIPFLVFFNPSLLLLFWFSNLIFYIISCLKHHEIFKAEDLILSLIYPYYMLYFSILGTFSEAKWKK